MNQHYTYEALEQSNQYYEAILKNSQDLICVAKTDGYFEFVNGAWQMILGYSPKELMARPFLEFIHSDDHATTDAEVKRLSEGLPVVDFENRYIHKNGSIRYIRWRATPSDQGDKMYCVGRDITDRVHLNKELEALVDDRTRDLEKEIDGRRKIETRLRKSEERFELAAKASRDGVFDWNLQTNEIYFSPNWKAMLGYGDQEVANQVSAWEALIFPEDMGGFWTVYKEVVNKKRKGFELEFRMQHKKGHWVEILSRALAVYDEDDRALRIVGTHTDMTRRNRAKREIKEKDKSLRLSLDAARAGTWTWDIKTGEVIWDDRMQQIFGLEPGSFNGTFEAWKERVHPDDLADAEQATLRALEQGARYEKEYRVKSASGQWRIVKAHAGVLKDENGAPLRMSGFAIDVTRKKAMEDKLVESEQNFKLLFEKAPLGYQSLDINGNFTQVNQTWLNIMGYDRREVIGQNFSRFLEPDWKEHFKENFPRFKAVGEVLGVEFRMVKKNGEGILVSFHGKVAKDSDGNFKRTHCVFNDITEQKSAEIQLRLELKINQAIADISKRLLSETYDIKKVSKAALAHARELTGSAHGFVSSIDQETVENGGHILTGMFGEQCRFRDENIGFPIGSEGEYSGLWGHALNTSQAFFTNSPATHYKSIGLPQGYIPLANYLAVPVRMGDTCLGLIALANSHRDYNEQDIYNIQRIGEIFALALHRQAYEKEREQLEASLRQLQKNEAIGVLAGGIAHDFNNILFPIIGFAELLEEDIENTSPLKKSVAEILCGANRAKELVKQILTFSRQVEQELRPLKPQLLVKEVIKLIKATIPSTIEIKQEIDPECRKIMADPTQIHQIAMNLITNAYYAMKDSGGRLSVKLKNVELSDKPSGLALDAGPHILLSVEDSGVGMDQETAGKIFDPYFTTKPKEKGTGLGLSVVHGIVKNYRGDIQVTSRPGEGTIFKVYLPAIETRVSADETIPAPMTHRGDANILLVDDEQPVLRLEQQMLERLGHRVTVIDSSLKALGMVSAHPGKYDVVISDMTMPQMTGDVLAKKIRKINPELPIIICTGFSERLTPEKASRIGINDVLIKPISRVKMSEAIKRVLE